MKAEITKPHDKIMAFEEVAREYGHPYINSDVMHGIIFDKDSYEVGRYKEHVLEIMCRSYQRCLWYEFGHSVMEISRSRLTSIDGLYPNDPRWKQ
jgi:hypothetical protein